MRKLTILVTPINAVGHVNACSGALTGVLARGHRVIFVIEDTFEGKLSAQGYEEFVYSSSKIETSSNNQENADENEPIKKANSTQNENPTKKANPGDALAQILIDNKIIGPFSPLEKMANMFKSTGKKERKYDQHFRLNAATEEAIELFKPDLIYFDGFPLPPVVYYSGIPWIKQFSTTPIFFIVDLELPPGGSGLPTEDRSDWHLFEQYRAQFHRNPKFSELNLEMGYDRFPNDELFPETQVMTVHAYPEELNYQAIREKGWFNLEVFNVDRNRQTLVELKHLVPLEFLENNLNEKFSGKLIYLSMGSMGSIDLDLMKRLVQILGETNHKYIVSKGPRHGEFDLAENMYGDRYLPQTKIVPHVDLVITHGGNNTVTETFVEGKPMIILPSFADQFDNAQRLHETGFGARIDPTNFTADDLVGAIDRLLEDEKMKLKLERAAKRIKGSNRHDELAERIEQLFS